MHPVYNTFPPLNPPHALNLRERCQREELYVTPLIDLIEKMGFEALFAKKEKLFIQTLRNHVEGVWDLTVPSDLHRVMLELLLRDTSYPDYPEEEIEKFWKAGEIYFSC